jgi:hypothetical protein
MRAVAVAVVGAAVAVVLAVGCAPSLPSSYHCTTDAQCSSTAGQGRCEASGACSFPDAACSDGRRYGEFAPPGLAGACVDAAGVGSDGGADLSGGVSGDLATVPGTITRVGSTAVPSASRTSIMLPAPATLTAGDLVFVSILLTDSNVNVTPPPGWTQHADLHGATGGEFHAVWYYKVAATEPSSWTFALSASTNAAASAVAYRSVDAAAPIDVSTTQQFEGASFVAPSITTTHAGDMLVTMFVQGQSGTLNWHAPTGMQTAADNGPIGIFDVTQPTAGATGDKQATLGIVSVPGIGAVDYVALTPK